MKKLSIVSILGILTLSFITSCANMTDDYDQEQMAEPTPVIKETEKQKKRSVSYITEFGTAPAKTDRDYAFAMTEKELFPLYAEKKTFAGWTDSVSGTLINVKHKITDDMVLTANWRDIQAGDIVLAEGPIVSTECYGVVKNSVHPMAIIYQATGGKYMGVSVKTTRTFWTDLTSKRVTSIKFSKTGKESYESIKKENRTIFTDKNFPVLAYAEHYADLFTDIQNCQYATGWYIPAEEELKKVYQEFSIINKSYAKIEKNSKLVQNYTSLDGAWTSSSDGTYIYGIGLVKSGDYEEMRRSLVSRKQETPPYLVGYTEYSITIGSSAYKFFTMRMNSTKTLNAYCIRKF